MRADLHPNYTTILPSFYTDVFTEQDVLRQFLSGVDLIHMQTKKDGDDAQAYIAANEAPALHTSITEELYLTKSERTSITYEEDSALLYGITDDADQLYGAQDTNSRWVYDLGDPTIKSIGYLADNIYNPSYIYTEGIDFFVDNGLIILAVSAPDLFSQLQSTSADDLVDEPDFQLIGYNVRRDKQQLNKQLGYVFGIGPPPTTLGRDVFQGLWKLFTFGPSWYWTMFTLSRALGSDIVRTKKETVVATKENTPYGAVVVTESNTYNVSGSPAAVGTTIYCGYPASTDISVLHELEGTFAAGISGVVDLNDDGGITQAYAALSEGGAGNIYLLPENLILIELDPSLSDAETSKLIDVFEAVLAKNTKMIIIFGVTGVAAAGVLDHTRNDDPLAIETVIMDVTTSVRSVSTSKLRMSTR